MQLENQVKTTHMATLASSNRNVKIGLLVLGSWMKKNNLNRKYNAMTTWRATCAKGHASLMTQKFEHFHRSLRQHQDMLLNNFIARRNRSSRKSFFNDWKARIHRRKAALSVIAKLQESSYLGYKRLHFQKWKVYTVLFEQVDNFKHQKQAFFETHNHQLSEAKSAQQQLARENCEALANIAREKQDEIASLIQAHQNEKAKLLEEIGRKERLMVEEHSEKTRAGQKRIEDLVAQVNSKNQRVGRGT